MKSKLVVKNGFSPLFVNRVVFYNPNKDKYFSLKFKKIKSFTNRGNLVVLSKAFCDVNSKNPEEIYNLINNSDLESVDVSSNDKDLTLDYLSIEVDNKIIDFDSYYLDLVNLNVA